MNWFFRRFAAVVMNSEEILLTHGFFCAMKNACERLRFVRRMRKPGLAAVTAEKRLVSECERSAG